MKKIGFIKGLKITLFVWIMGMVQSCGVNNDKALTAQLGDANCYCTSGADSIYFSGTVPFDGNGYQGINNQGVADCFAWQQFIALNWPVDAAHTFGAPGDLAQVQWETYIPENILFNDSGSAPPAWGTWDVFQSVKGHKDFKSLKNSGVKLLSMSSKFGIGDTGAFGISEAAPFNGPNWLGAQNGTNVWYEVLLNKDYYDYVTQKGFYNAKTQHDSVKLGQFINFPVGASPTQVGAIELKIAWMEVDSPGAEKWQRYKLSQAVVVDPKTKTIRSVTVALVGMHILHKTASQPTWVWSTFEQVDNVADDDSITGISHPYGYNFFNPNCSQNCTPNISPTYYLSDSTPSPIQVTRVNAFTKTASNIAINKTIQAAIQNKYPNSVWQYYQLVDVIWGQSEPLNSPTDTLSAPNTIQFGQKSDYAAVANTTMETYIQSNTCLDCHRFSTIAPYALDAGNNKKFGDFSFAISAAKFKNSQQIANQKTMAYVRKKLH